MHAAPTGFNLPNLLLGEQFRLQIPSVLHLIEPTVGYLKDRALRSGVCDEARARKLELALHEALTNSVVHGNLEVASKLKDDDSDAFARALAERGADPAYSGRTVTIGVDCDGERCRWSLTDEGRGFDVETVLRQIEPTEENLLTPSGRGILMMRAFLDEVRFEAGGRRVVMTLHRAYKNEQRQHPRVAEQRGVRVAPIRADGSVDWEAARDGLIRDVSAGGISLLHKDLARVERIIIGLDVDGRPVYIPAEVRHWKALDGGVMDIGCRFLLNTPSKAEALLCERLKVQSAVAELLSHLDARELPADERRAYPRVGYTERITIEGPTATDPRSAYARDLSGSGIAFITAAPVTLETKVLTLPGKGDTPLRIRAHIVRCAPVAEGFYDVGARFEALVA
jgi:anti-sigma regulatory factor (Ser/Thr protein kinase)